MPANAGISLTDEQRESLVVARVGCKITQQRLAGRLGVSQGMVALYEAGKRRPALDVLRAWAAAVGFVVVESGLELRRRVKTKP